MAEGLWRLLGDNLAPESPGDSASEWNLAGGQVRSSAVTAELGKTISEASAEVASAIEAVKPACPNTV